MKSTNKDMAHSLAFWGVPKIYKYGVRVMATNYNHVSDKTKAVFAAMRTFQKAGGMSSADVTYWERKGWLGKVRPWK